MKNGIIAFGLVRSGSNFNAYMLITLLKWKKRLMALYIPFIYFKLFFKYRNEMMIV